MLKDKIFDIEHNEKYFALKFKIGFQEYAMISNIEKGVRFIINDVSCKTDFQLICKACFYEKLQQHLATTKLLHHNHK